MRVARPGSPGRRDRRTVRVLSVVLAAGLVGTSCPNALAQTEAAASGRVCRSGGEPLTRTELIFGTGRGTRPPVSSDEWASFVDGEIAPRFPDGFTLLDGRGQWRDATGAARETSHLLIVWHRASPGQDEAFETIRSVYRQRFGQGSVMRIDGADCVSF